jgi:hypothetical protein
MPDGYRIQLYWAPRQEAVGALARRLFEMLAELREIDGTLARFVYDQEDRDVLVESLDDCRDALDQGAVAWQFGRSERIAHEVTLSASRVVAPAFAFTLTCGIEPDHVGGLFAPNRLEMWVRRDAPGELATTSGLQRLVSAVAARWDADFGYVGAPTIPPAPAPLLSVGEPPVGWMTYLSKRLPTPPPLRSPAVTYPVGGSGSLVVAHPNLFRLHVKEHHEAMARVADALRTAGVLTPTVKVDQPPS